MGKPFQAFCDEKWEQVRSHPYFAEYRENVFKKAAYYIENDPPVLKFSLLHRYVQDGNRELYEARYENYFARMQCFFAAYMISGDEAYLEPLSDIIWNICDMESWSIPAHVAEHLSISERRSNLDLCSTIAGFRLSEIIYFIGDKLPELIVKRAKAEIRYRVIDSYARATTKRYWWLIAESNWSAVCIAAVLGTYIYAAEKHEIDAQLPRMIESAEAYLRGFADDGCCSEGYGYWNYGFSYFCIFAEMLREYTDGKIDYFKRPKVVRIAHFQESIPLNEKQCVSFADGALEFTPLSWLSHFLKGKYPDLRIPALKAIGAGDLVVHSLLYQNPDMYESSLDATEPVSFCFENAQWFIYRNAAYSLGCKAGHNKEQHNHNDVGSFLISKNGEVTFCDPGVGQYTRQYFSPERYELFLCSSRGHSVPIINGTLQDTIGDMATLYEHTDTSYCFSMEKVYRVESLKSLRRDFLCEEDGVSLTDTYEFTEMPTSVVERFVSLRPITESDGRILCGDSVMLYDADAFTVSFGSEEVERKQGKTGTVYYVDLTVKSPQKNMRFNFRFI